MKLKTLIIAITLLSCSAQSDSDTQEQIESIQQPLHSWNNYHWNKPADAQLQLTLNSNLSPSWAPYLVTSSNDWNLSSVLDTTIAVGNKNPKTCKPTLGKVEICNAAYGKNGWLGIAQIWTDQTGHIVQGVVKLNDSYFNTAKYNTVGFKNLVMCQEVGHTFGLDHQDEAQTNTNLGTCMDYTTNPVGPPSNEHPNAHDYEELESIYAHVDTTVATASNGYQLLTHVFPVK